jgi:parallel beta-helix repeat protein
MKSFVKISAYCAMLLVAISPAFAETLDVPAEYGSIQAGLNASADGDTVLVQPGTYVENIVWPIVNGIKLIAAGDTSDTFIDGNQVERVIYMSSGGVIDTTTVIHGFTIRNGSSSGDGGGIYCYSSSPTISNCNIAGNHSISEISAGGGMFFHISSPIISDCTISGNSANDGGGIYSRSGSNPIINDCTISENTAHYDGGGIWCGMGSIPIISDCNISGNSADDGAGIHCYQGGIPSIRNSVITGNTAISDGGGISCYTNSDAIINSCTISRNSAASGGGVFCISNSSPTINNCAITDNTGEGVYSSNAGGTSDPQITYSDVDNNSLGDFGGDVAPDLGVIVGVNANGDPRDPYFNISLDPMYADPDAGDFQLQVTSPCIDAGDPSTPLDPDGTLADIGAFYFDQSDLLLVTVTLTPTSSTYLTASGGTISFDVHVVSNVADTYPNVMFWTKVKLPNGIFYPQVQFQTTFTLTPYMDVSGSLNQDIPAFAPAGDYEMWGWVGQNPNFGPSFGGFFTFFKDEGVTDGSSVNDWSSNGYMIANNATQKDALPTSYDMKSAYPNPFNPTTTINVVLPEAAELTVSVYNVTGQQVAELANGYLNAGSHTLTFDASGMASGLYFVRATVPDQMDQTQKLMLVR